MMMMIIIIIIILIDSIPANGIILSKNFSVYLNAMTLIELE